MKKNAASPILNLNPNPHRTMEDKTTTQRKPW